METGQGKENSTNSSNHVERDAIIYMLQPMPAAADSGEPDEDDSFYEVTARDVAMMQRDLTEKLNRELSLIPTRFVEEKNDELKKQAWKNTTIRFSLECERLTTIQALFASSEPVSALFEFIHHNFYALDRFELRCVHEKLAHDDQRTLLQAGLAPRSILTLRTLDKLSDDNLDAPIQACSFRICSKEEADQISSQWQSANCTYRPFLTGEKMTKALQLVAGTEKTTEPDPSEYEPSPSLQRQKGNQGQLPKWFKPK